MATSVFAKYYAQNYPYVYAGELEVRDIYGGVPTDPKVAEAWLRTKVETTDEMIKEEVDRIMEARGVDKDTAIAEVNLNRHLNGFRRDEKGLYIGGYQLKAALKEAVNVCLNVEMLPKSWGATRKGITQWFPEHVFVIEDRLYLDAMEPTRVDQKFVHTWRGNAIGYEEVVEKARIPFTIECDFEISEEQWAAIWTHGERQGIGASRSMSHGRYVVTRWEQLGAPKAKSKPQHKAEPGNERET